MPICQKSTRGSSKRRLAKVLAISPNIGNSIRFNAIRPGVTFEEIAKAIGTGEVWVASAFYGQVCLPHILASTR